MFGFFERLVDPFPKQLAQRPPRGVYQFCRHYTQGMEPWLLLMAGLTAITAISEALLFVFWARWLIGYRQEIQKTLCSSLAVTWWRWLFLC